MVEVIGFSDDEDSSMGEGEDSGIMPKVEVLDCELPDENTYSMHIGDNVASSSGSNLRSSLMGMGFKPSLVDRAIEENGDSNIEVLLEALFSYSAGQKPKSEASSDSLFYYNRDAPTATSGAMQALHRSNSSDFLGSLFGERNAGCPSIGGGDAEVKEDPDAFAGVGEEKKASLLRMNFAPDEIEFAIDKLGIDSPVDELVDFIFAARIAENCERDADGLIHKDKETDKECNPEILFGTMEKTLRLLEMGFTENEISVAIDKHGSEVPIEVLANSIVMGESYSVNNILGFPSTIKVEQCQYEECQYEDFGMLEKLKGKRPKEEYIDEPSIFKRPKQEYNDNSINSPTWIEARNANRTPLVGSRTPGSGRRVHRKAENLNNGMLRLSMPSSCKSLDRTVIEPPYFFYGNVTNLSHDSWVKISQFLYEIEPEFVNAGEFSAVNRREGYVHNLPNQNRFHIRPKPPMTIEEAMPQTTKWWPLWDTRKQLSGISSETARASQICNKLGRTLTASRGILSSEQQREILHQCEMLNLVWAGQNRLAPMEPEHLERILGYPLNHTRAAGFSLTDRFQSLENSFQVDTVAYHLSGLRPFYPGGLNVLSMYSGIGGVEIALHKLDIYLKALVSIEPCEIKRRILKQWWEQSGQSGELVQIEGIQVLSSSKLENLIKRFGGFDLVICQNPSAAQSSSSSNSSFDFSLFYEFVRVVQRVRSAAKEKNKVKVISH